jgi:hypothetical protein
VKLHKYEILRLLLITCRNLDFDDKQIRWLYAQMDLQINLYIEDKEEV